MDVDLKEALAALGRAIERRDNRPPCSCSCTERPRYRPRQADLEAARRIAGDQSMQTGRNYQNFTSGNYDHAFGVRTALAAIAYGRANP